MFHSQHEIEKYLNHYFQQPGVFLEIGCWDGELISQTAWLERERGWSGVCVDPFARNFGKRTCRVCRKAVVGNEKALGEDGVGREFVRVSTDRRDNGDVSYFSGFRDRLTAHWELISTHCNYEIVPVETITMDELHREYSLPAHMDFLSVDVEGAELEIFESIDFERLSFGLIVFEHNEDELVRVRVGALLMEHGYVLIASMRCDDVYVSGELLAVSGS